LNVHPHDNVHFPKHQGICFGGIGAFVMRALMIIAIALAVTSCARLRQDTAVAFDGVYFNAKVTADKAKLENFEIFVAKASKSIAGAREAGRYEATKYCVRNFGTSDVTWTYGPDDTDVQILDDSLYLKGTCQL
jgi:predicted tellurium resistance membrane protein TerC